MMIQMKRFFRRRRMIVWVSHARRKSTRIAHRESSGGVLKLVPLIRPQKV